jgi:hypothetical protein
MSCVYVYYACVFVCVLHISRRLELCQLRIHIHTHTHTYVYTYIHVYTCAHMQSCIYIYMLINMEKARLSTFSRPVFSSLQRRSAVTFFIRNFFGHYLSICCESILVTTTTLEP